MCGIAGALFTDDTVDPCRRVPAVSAMVTALEHRGPDGRGVTACTVPSAGSSANAAAPTAVLGHTRLAIIDLSDRAAQPMKSVAAPVWITYNGEIYNFGSLRAELEAMGRTFRSASDTEVVLQAYEAWGEAMIERLRGMFALAIWDGRTRELLLARDRLGIKPLYVHRGRGVLLFASEVRALLASGLVPRRLDAAAVEQYLAYQTVPTPGTLVDAVRMIEPGHRLGVHAEGRVEDRRYWDLLDDRSPASEDAAAAREAVRARLAESARLHLVSDVPVGVFLSGGIDSSALVALTREAGAAPRAFTVVLPGTAHDEAPFARAVARRFGVEHVEITIGEAEVRDRMPETLGRVDHPSGDGFNSFLVSRAVRSAGVKVALSGLGGDELFGGYPSFRRLGRLAGFARWWRQSPLVIRAAAAAAMRAAGGRSLRSEKVAALLETDGSLPRTFPLMRQLFTLRQRSALLGDALVAESAGEGDPYVALLDDAMRRHPEAGLMSLVAYAEARTYMHDVLLRDTDQMSMAHGLEVRVPLLDHPLVEYVMGLGEVARRPSGAPKRLLVDSLGSDLPPECVHRPKQGFVLPFDAWMREGLREFCEDRLGPRGLSGRGPFRAEAVASLWQSFLKRDGRTTWSRLWALVALDAWIQANGVSA